MIKLYYYLDGNFRTTFKYKKINHAIDYSKQQRKNAFSVISVKEQSLFYCYSNNNKRYKHWHDISTFMQVNIKWGNGWEKVKV